MVGGDGRDGRDGRDGMISYFDVMQRRRSNKIYNQKIKFYNFKQLLLCRTCRLVNQQNSNIQNKQSINQ